MQRRSDRNRRSGPPEARADLRPSRGRSSKGRGTSARSAARRDLIRAFPVVEALPAKGSDLVGSCEMNGRHRPKSGGRSMPVGRVGP